MLLVLVPLIFELVFLLSLIRCLDKLAQDFDLLNHSQKIIYQLHTMVFGLSKAGVTLVTLDALPPKERLKATRMVNANFLEEGHIGGIDLSTDAEFKELFDDVETSRALFIKVLRQFKERAIKDGMAGYTNKDRDDIIMSLLTMNSIIDRIKSTSNRMDAAEPEKLEHMFEELLIVLLVGAALSCFITLFFARVLTVDIIRRLNAISNDAYLLAAGQPLPPRQKGSDEISELEEALRRTEAKMQEMRNNELAILNNTADVVCSLDRQLRFLTVGDPVEANWDYKPQDLLGRSLVTLIDSDTAGSVHEDFERVRTLATVSEIDIQLKCRSGRLKDLSWTVVWIEQEGCFACVVHDVTELKRLERLKQAFFSMVSHDLRTPLTAISVNVENLRSEKDSEVYKNSERLLGIISSSITRLKSLVDDLLDLDKIDAGKLDLEVECISLRDVCLAATTTLEAMAQDAGIELKSPRHDAAVMADEKRLIQVVTNLISNAIKFSARGTSVTVSIRRHGDDVEVAVTDQGPGIPENIQKTLFDRYSQGKASSNVSIKSSGLGLAIVASLVQAHGGEIGIRSEEGKGATFWFRLKEFTDDEPLLYSDNSDNSEYSEYSEGSR